MGIFTPKAGGTFFGNLLRDAAHKVSPLLGNGGAMITQQQEDHRDMSEDLYIQKYGKDKSGRVVEGVSPNPSINNPNREFDSLGKTKGQRFWSTVWGWLKRNWLILVLPVVVFLLYKGVKWLLNRGKGNRLKMYKKRW